MSRSTQNHSTDVEQLRRIAAHWRARALEFLELAKGTDRSMHLRAAEQANKLAAHFERELARVDRK